MANPMPDLCIVVPTFNEERNVSALHETIAAVLDARGIRFTLMFVDDGSRDSTVDVVRALASTDPRVRGLRLSRNFGHQAAITMGLSHARGRAIAVMDADLQDRPEDLVLLYDAWREGAEVAYAVRSTRVEGLHLRFAYRAFYRLLSMLADVSLPQDAGDFCVMDGTFVARLIALPERLRYVRGLRAWLGGKQVGVPVSRGRRLHGSSQYTLRKLVRLALDGIFSFSHAPLRLASVVGGVVSLLAFVGVLVVLWWRVRGDLPEGWGLATIALGVFFLGGLQLLTIGIVGEYVGRIYQEVKGRPIAVVAETIGEIEEMRNGWFQSAR